MITVLTGENSFEVSRALEAIVAGFDGTAERVDGSELQPQQLPGLLTGMTLFASKRLIVIKNLSENKALWAGFADWIDKISDEIHVVLVEPKPDKRTRTYKELQKHASMKDYAPLSDRDIRTAETWVAEEAKKQGCNLDAKNVRLLVERVGTDQWQLFHVLQKLAVLDNVTAEIIKELVEPRESENVFELFEAALRGNAQRLMAMLRTLELTEDPYRVFGLLAGQTFQLAALAAADKPAAAVAKDIGAHPFVLSKLAPFAEKLGREGTKHTVRSLARADDAIKTGVEPWLAIEQALVRIAAFTQNK